MNKLLSLFIAMIVGLVLGLSMLTLVSYQENRMFCKYDLAECKRPFIPFINM